ncbi:MAG: hypothetical protein KG003_13985 [Bacteroidetes bacterium]|nr:hypothetical protein [Bacteroidota bacterium]
MEFESFHNFPRRNNFIPSEIYGEYLPSMESIHSDPISIGIAVAWPETLCKQAGSWYDFILKRIGINENNYYKVGHAAIILVDPLNRECRYFDFGRYHAPAGFGRVRNADTDTDLKINTRAEMDDKSGYVRNLKEILLELENNPSCHGNGKPIGAQTTIRFQTAYMRALKMQETGFIPYGPFTIRGTNCSRFVRSILISGMLPGFSKLKLRFPWTFSPLPVHNVNCLKHEISRI